MAKMSKNPLEYRRLRLIMARAVRKPRIEYSAVCKSLSFQEPWSEGKGLGDEDKINMRTQYANSGNQ